MSVYKGQEKVLNSITAVEEAKVKEIAREVMKEKKYGCIAFSAFLNAFLNYYFFQQVILAFPDLFEKVRNLILFYLSKLFLYNCYS